MHESGTRYRPLQDFTWMSTICTAPMVLIVKPDFPARTAQEAFDLLRSERSGSLDYSSSGPGSIPHIAPRCSSTRSRRTLTFPIAAVRLRC